MSGQCEKGFTLVELLIAFVIVAVTFSSLLDLLSTGLSLYDGSNQKFEDLITLDAKVKEGKLKDIKVHEAEVPDFPRVKEVIYTYGDIFIVRYYVR